MKKKKSQLEKLAAAHYGATGWRSKLAKEMKVNRATVWRWEQDGPPESVLVALRCLSR